MKSERSSALPYREMANDLANLEQMQRVNDAWERTGSPAPQDDSAWLAIADICGCNVNDLSHLRAQLRGQPPGRPPFADEELQRTHVRIEESLGLPGGTLTGELAQLAQMHRLNTAWVQVGRPKPSDEAGWPRLEAIWCGNEPSLQAIRAKLVGRPFQPPYSSEEIECITSQMRIRGVRARVALDEPSSGLLDG
jgi:hypothetical protein